MRSLPWHTSFVRRLALFLLALAFYGPAAARAQDRQKQVLVLYSTRWDAQVAVLGERELPRILRGSLPDGLDYYSETLDQGRFPDPAYQNSLEAFLRWKYQAYRFDVVVAMSDAALTFIERNRTELFRDSAVVYVTTSATTPRMPNSTGIVSALGLGGSLALAAELQPDVKNVFVVSGAAADRVYETAAREQFRPLDGRFTFTYLTGLPTRELETRLSALPPHSIVYYLVINQDGTGERFHPLHYLDRIAAVSSAPIYSWVDSAMDHGVVGGLLKSQQNEIEAVGQLARRVLAGESADAIPAAAPDLRVSRVDWRQLQRWGIDESRVPAGTITMFRELTVWDRYGGYIIAALVLFLAQTGLIVGLIVQRTRRREAEARILKGQADLRTSYDRIRDLGGRLLKAQDDERSHLARELHDDINQQMALLEIDLELLSAGAEGKTREFAGHAVTRAQAITRSIHDLSHRLHPARLRLIGLVSALSGLQRDLAREGVAISFTHENVPPAIPPDLTLCVFRVVQEALHNALKHSGARQASVHLSGEPGALAVTIADSGTGFDVKNAWGKGLGLLSMSERLEAVGGMLDVRSSPGSGTSVRFRVPVRSVEGAGAVAV